MDLTETSGLGMLACIFMALISLPLAFVAARLCLHAVMRWMNRPIASSASEDLQ